MDGGSQESPTGFLPYPCSLRAGGATSSTTLSPDLRPKLCCFPQNETSQDLLHWPIPFDFGRRHLHDLDLGHLVAPEQVQVFATAEAPSALELGRCPLGPALQGRILFGDILPPLTRIFQGLRLHFHHCFGHFFLMDCNGYKIITMCYFVYMSNKFSSLRLSHRISDWIHKKTCSPKVVPKPSTNTSLDIQDKSTCIGGRLCADKSNMQMHFMDQLADQLYSSFPFWRSQTNVTMQRLVYCICL